MRTSRIDHMDRIDTVFLILVALWTLAAVVVAFASGRWTALIAVPAAVAMAVAARSERLTQSAQLIWPVILLPGAVFMFIGAMQTMGYGRMENEPAVTGTLARGIFFGSGMLLHLAAFALLASESRASDHLSGDVADRMP